MYGITTVAFGESSDEIERGWDLGHQFSFTWCEGYSLLFKASAMCCFSLCLSGIYVQIFLARAIKFLATATLCASGWWKVKPK